MTPKILIVDDDRNICEILEFNLKSEGFGVECAYSAEEALKKLTGGGFSLILLDVMMDGMSGYKMAEKLRTEGNTVPIIFLTAKDTENDMLTGFSVGGDDYIAKPFSIKEVVARIKAVVKRLTSGVSAEKSRKLTFGDMVIDLEVKELTIKDEKIVLTKTEFEILAMLVGSPERIFSREDFIARIWKEAPYITERTVDVHITRLRKKMGGYASVITNRAGYGYRFNADSLT